LSSIDKKDAKRIVEICLAAATTDDVEQVVRHEFGALWPDLFPPTALPAKPDAA
jgi:hypothetical protein